MAFSRDKSNINYVEGGDADNNKLIGANKNNLPQRLMLKNLPYLFTSRKRGIMKKRISLLVILLVIISMTMSPFSVFAATTSSTLITGNVPASISLTATSSLALPSLVPGSMVESSYITVTISSNLTGWSLTAAESGSGADGKMDRSGGGSMTNALEIQGGNVSTYTPLSTTVILRDANGTPGTIPFENIKFRQAVAANEVAGNYSMTVVFTVSGGA